MAGWHHKHKLLGPGMQSEVSEAMGTMLSCRQNTAWLQLPCLESHGVAQHHIKTMEGVDFAPSA